MRNATVGVVLALGLLVASGCGRDFSLPDNGQDSTPPGFSGVTLSPAQATVGTTVTLEFDASEALPPEVEEEGVSVPNPQVSVAARSFECTVVETHHRCTLTVELGMEEGAYEISVRGRDAAGNLSVPLAPPPRLVLDFTPPLLTVTANPPQVEPAQILQITIRSDESLAAAPALSASFFPTEVCADDTGVGRLFSCTIQLPFAMPEADDLPHVVEARSADLAGNQAQGQTTVILSRPSPQLDPTSVRVLPRVATDGESVSLGFRSVGGRLDRCGLIVGTRVATCLETHIDDGTEPAFTECACSFDVVPAVPEGIQTASLIGTTRRGSAQLTTHFNVDRTPPWLDGSKLHFLRRSPGVEDAVWAEAGAVGDDLGLPYTDPAPTVVRVHLWDGPGASANRLTSLGPAPDGSLASAAAPTPLGDTSTTVLYAAAEDIAGNLGPRVPAGQVEATLTFEGRTPYDPSVSPLSVHAFETDLDPVAYPPGFGAARGEASLSAIAEVSFEDGAALRTVAPIPTSPSPWGVEEQYQLRGLDRVGRNRVSAFRHPVTGAFEIRGGQSNICSGGSWSRGGQSYLDGGFSPGTSFSELSLQFFSGDYDPQREVEVWTDANGNVVECGGMGGCTRLTPALRPTTSSDARSVYHPGLGKLVRFGGMEAPGGVYVFYNETWAYDPLAIGGPAWSQIPASTRPGGRAGHAMTVDEASVDGAGNQVGPRAYVFGGYVGQAQTEQRYSDLWAFDGADWSRLDTGGLPGARSHSVIVRDGARNRLLVSGGIRWVGTASNGYPDVRIDDDVQAYDLATGTWSTLRPFAANGCAWVPDPGPCNFAAAGVWDPVAGRLLVYADGEVWAFHEDPGGSAGTWENLTPTTVPEPRYLGALIDLPGAGQLALVGGNTETGLVSTGLSLWDGRWYDLATDPLRSDLPPVNAVQVPDRPATLLLIDQTSWSLSEVGGGEARIEASDLALPTSGIRAATFDTSRQEAILLDGSIPPRTYAYDGERLRLLPVDSPPPFRDRYGLAFDAATGEVLFFGGRTFNGTVTDELWAFDGRTWSLRQPAASPLPAGNDWGCGTTGGWPTQPPQPSPVPEARADATFVFDAASGRSLLFGGEDASGATLNDLWSLEAQGWRLLAMPECRWNAGVVLPTGCSSGFSDYDGVVGSRVGASAVYATADRATYFFGGRQGAAPIMDKGFGLRAISRPDAGRTPTHLFRLRLERGASLSSLVLHHRGQGLSPRGLGVPEPGLRLHVWVGTEDPATGFPLGWVEVSPTGASETNEILDLDVGAILSDPLFTPAGLVLPDLVLAEQVWILVTPSQPSQRYLTDGHAELLTDQFWVDATYSF